MTQGDTASNSGSRSTPYSVHSTPYYGVLDGVAGEKKKRMWDDVGCGWWLVMALFLNGKQELVIAGGAMRL